MLSGTSLSALRTLVYLSQHMPAVISPRRIAEDLGESPTYLSKVTTQLVKAGVLRAEKGVKGGVFMPIGFELFSIMRDYFRPVDIVAVVRHNQKLRRGNWHKAAEEGNYFLRGFNYLFIMKKE